MKKLLIVGASRGLGLGMAEEHVRRGWQVTATARTDRAGLEALAAKAENRLEIETVDILDRVGMRALGQRLGDQSFDLVLLNAGIMAGRGMALGDIPDPDIVAIFMTNAIAPVRAADVLIGRVAPGGTIAFMSSILGSVGTNEDGRAEQGGSQLADPQLPRAPRPSRPHGAGSASRCGAHIDGRAERAARYRD
jgi:NAD(P)-dependent dehydrogenase (short-subunit alcohol dehydrogenase family)